MEDRFDIWRNDTSTSVLDEKHKKNGISIFIVTSDHDMSSLLRKFRGSKDMPQRSRQKHGTYAMAQDSVDKKTNPSVDNLQLPTNGEHFEDGNHQKQVPMLYRILWNGNFFFFSEFFISSYVWWRSNKDAKDLQQFNIYS